MQALIEVNVDSLNGLKDKIGEWEDIEFPVDSGAGGIVFGPEDVKAVKAIESFNGGTEEGELRNIIAAMTDVDKPLLGVSQVVLSGATVVFSPKGNYRGSPGGKRDPLELQGSIYTLKMWVPRKQHTPFQGPAWVRS